MSTLIEIMDALAAQLHTELDAEIPGIQIEGRMNINPSPDPVALDIYPGDPFQEPDAFGLGENDIMLTIRARVNTPDSEGAQDALLALMDPKASTSVEQAVLADPSLSSTVGNLKIEIPPSNYGIFPDASGVAAYLGCTWTIRVIPGEGEPPVPACPIFVVTVDLDTAEIAALASSPVTLVATPGAGEVLAPVAAVFSYNGATVRFGAGATPTLVADGEEDGWTAAIDFTDITAQLSNFASDTPIPLVTDAALVLTADSDPGFSGPIDTMTINDGGNFWVPGDSATVSDGVGGTITVDSVVNAFEVVGVNQGSKTFTLDGDASAFQPADTLFVYRSTGNDTGFTIVSATFGAGTTDVVVVEAIPDPTVDGWAGDQSIAPLGDIGGIGTFTISDPGNDYHVGDVVIEGVAPSTGSAQFQVTAVTGGGGTDGTARVSVCYYVMETV